MMRNAYYSDSVYYQQGKIIIATIAVIIWLNLVLFLLSFILGFCRFMKKCPCCRKKLRTKEPLVKDLDKSIDYGPRDELWKPPTPIPTPTPTPSIETPPPEPEPEKPRTPTPPPPEESSESEPEIIIGAAAVLVKDS